MIREKILSTPSCYPTSFFVMDIFHALEHMRKAALFFHDEDSPEESVTLALWSFSNYKKHLNNEQSAKK
ncbi:hypothetical protein [Desulfomonile tiedjei]|uniref:Uncharacterized protein n=1 Tax=Desulfomonile tiedjei (strain ATCC 49306 / DSM 6799 / DCB-1) TaxID=706587 RepID=I4CC35_DESTA|nr:hypothetical protein [Desulfomonile tiedjei]AFM27126.1 hypothetical protein Desti_4495 [Desulfomonile tiedjei DSM 6799]